MDIKTHFLDEALVYDGSQLRSHFSYDQFQLQGDSIVAFCGACDVKAENMVDKEDSSRNLFIKSNEMLHFIVEHFHFDLFAAIACQRLLITNLQQEILYHIPELQIIRRGDDLFDDSAKLSVSIATSSPVSQLIHVGINIDSKDTPVLTKGLNDYKLSPAAIARGVMNRYREEIQSMTKARTKVRGVQ